MSAMRVTESDVLKPNRLFGVRNKHTNKWAGRADVHWFANKPNAKARRDELNGGLADDPNKKWNKDKGWRVTYGPDHWRYES